MGSEGWLGESVKDEAIRGCYHAMAFLASCHLEHLVRANYQHELHRWPLLISRTTEGYLWRGTHIVIVLRDRTGGIPTLGDLRVLTDSGVPASEPEAEPLQWLDYAIERFRVTGRDLVVMVPAIPNPAGGTNVFERLTPEQVQVWALQIAHNAERQHASLMGLDTKTGFFVPPGYRFLTEGCSKLFADHPEYARNVFIMMRFVPGNRLLEALDAELRDALRGRGLNPIRADDRMYLKDRSLWNNVCVYMLCCKYGVAVLEDRIQDEFNPNVALEYGFMRALDKDVLLLADVSFRNLRADIVGTLRERFDITDIPGTVRPAVEKWLSDVGLRHSG